ncbi:Coenzyme F420 hydrogenase/dehydrogenase, beta subunit C-terminal domain [Thiomicrorhabdus sp.]|uniref:Coenzyme F420 hydrogenase/dehydrogenase, beta subunit C-terminal domain n=1 Tax=Thiomicrorhabdus sp. TaxID=2039724 RepID=UPI0029C6A576|nr:Coenzyme F420 hydrogenase/dehydrogenase, beta subunit C-terminal domain [Thiomicrorhabdus sp.]
MEKIEKVIAGGYCIGCGACSVVNRHVTINEDGYGLYKADISPLARSNVPFNALSEVCPFSSSRDEDELGEVFFQEADSRDPSLGFFEQIYLGYVQEGEYRSNASSGGVITWVLAELFQQGMIDGVVHVGEAEGAGSLFTYRVSDTLEQVLGNSKTRYYPVEMSKVLQEIKDLDGVFAIVGVPCFIKAVRLLQMEDRKFKEKIKYCLSIFCGGFKSKQFSEMVASQFSIPIDKVGYIDYRKKNSEEDADKYFIEIGEKTSSGLSNVQESMARRLYGMDWGEGLFKPKACDWCDDITGELADLSSGDAWLPEYISDSGGSSVVVVRNKQINSMIRKAIESNRLKFKEGTVDLVVKSQDANFRHRREGLSFRIESADKSGVWHPDKRVSSADYSISSDRKKIYELRSRLSEQSHEKFNISKKSKGYAIFKFMGKMFPTQLYYAYKNKRTVKFLLKTVFFVATNLRRKFQ